MMLKDQGFQVFCAVSTCLGVMAGGTMVGYTSSAIPSLSNITSSANGLTMSEDEASLFSALQPFGLLVGFLSITPLFTYFGRKRSFLYVSGPGFLIGWIILIAAQNVAMLDIGRFIVGAAFAIPYAGSPMYIVETCDTNIRGLLASLPQVMMSAGIVLSYVVGMFLNWQQLAIVSMCCAVPFIVTVIFISESPHWLVEVGRKNEATDVLIKFTGSTVRASAEIMKMEEDIKETRENAVGYSALLEPSIMKAMGAAAGLMFFQQFCGINMIIFNAVDIFQAAGSQIDVYVSSIIVGSVQLSCNMVSSIFVERIGRKLLLLISSAGMGICLCALGVFFYLKDNLNQNVSDLGWLPLLSLVVYMAAFSVGYGPVPWILASELFTQNVRIKLNPIAAAINSICFFIVTYCYNPMKTSMGYYGCFWFYAGVSALSILFDLFCIPETKGKSFEEIQIFYNKKPRFQKNSDKRDIVLVMENADLDSPL